MSRFVPAIQTDALAFGKVLKNGRADPHGPAAIPRLPAAVLMLVAVKPAVTEEARRPECVLKHFLFTYCYYQETCWKSWY